MEWLCCAVVDVDGDDEPHVGAGGGEEGGVVGGDVGCGDDVVNARAALHTVHHSPVCQRARRVRRVEGVEQASAAQRIVQRGGVTVCLAIKVPAYYGGLGLRSWWRLWMARKAAFFSAKM